MAEIAYAAFRSESIDSVHIANPHFLPGVIGAGDFIKISYTPVSLQLILP